MEWPFKLKTGVVYELFALNNSFMIEV